ncbi:UbiX family flavin prenyltransferase [bacterium]|nr:UbiX family flavin prenyltransferase [bacterium]
MRYIVGISGASGVLYGKRLIELLTEENEVFLLITDTAKDIFKQELDIDANNYFADRKNIHYLDYHNFNTPLASGTFGIDGMVVVPCSMGTLSAIATGASNNLLERAADVALKERRRLILVPRETPLSEIHLINMLTLRRMGADILPAMPYFYNKPQSIADLVDSLVKRVLQVLNGDKESTL